jgi:hypothetical protein
MCVCFVCVGVCVCASVRVSVCVSVCASVWCAPDSGGRVLEVLSHSSRRPRQHQAVRRVTGLRHTHRGTEAERTERPG